MIEEQFSNKQVKIGLGLGSEYYLTDDLSIINDLIFKFTTTDVTANNGYFKSTAILTFPSFLSNVGLKLYI